MSGLRGGMGMGMSIGRMLSAGEFECCVVGWLVGLGLDEVFVWADCYCASSLFVN